QKNPLQAIRILSEIGQLNWEGLIMGEGPLESEMIREIKARSLGDRLKMTGWLSTQDVIKNMLESDILLMPSLSEGLPMVGLQALASGLALVTSRAGGLVDLVEEGKNGFLHESGDQAGFAASLTRLIQEPDLLKAMQNTSLRKAGNFDIE